MSIISFTEQRNCFQKTPVFGLTRILTLFLVFVLKYAMSISDRLTHLVYHIYNNDIISVSEQGSPSTISHLDYAQCGSEFRCERNEAHVILRCTDRMMETPEIGDYGDHFAYLRLLPRTQQHMDI